MYILSVMPPSCAANQNLVVKGLFELKLKELYVNRTSQIIDRFNKPQEGSSRQTSNTSTHTTPEEFKHATIVGQFRFVFEENSVVKIIVIVTSPFLKSSVFKCFPSTRKRKAGALKFRRFEEGFRKAPFS